MRKLYSTKPKGGEAHFSAKCDIVLGTLFAWGGAKMKMVFGAVFLAFIGAAIVAGVTAHQRENSSLQQTQVTTIPFALESASKWKISLDKNPLDGGTRLTISDGEVFIRCSPVFEGYLFPPLSNLGHMFETENGHKQTVRFRLDEGPIQSGTWTISDDFAALFFPTPMLLKLATAKVMILEYEPEYETAQTVNIDLVGLGEAEKRAGCVLPVPPKAPRIKHPPHDALSAQFGR